MSNEFSTKDLYLAAFLYARGLVFVRIYWQGRQGWFVFQDENKCVELQQRFFSRTAEVNAKEYANAIRTLKDLVFIG
jgi:hypothetical protein